MLNSMGGISIDEIEQAFKDDEDFKNVTIKNEGGQLIIDYEIDASADLRDGNGVYVDIA